MLCDCCRKRKKLFESYALIPTNKGSIHLCVECNDLLYKLRDASHDNNLKEYRELKKKLLAKHKKSSAAFVQWRDDYIATCEETLKANIK